MAEIIAGMEIPETAPAVEATRLIQDATSQLVFHHSRRVYLFAQIHARRLGVEPDPELLYLAAMFHDTGLFPRFASTQERFEVDGAEHARAFLRERGFSAAAADTVWAAVALHTTPGIPGRMGPEIAAIHFGVLTDAIGFQLQELDRDQVEEILAAHPRGDFKNEFLRTFVDGLKYRPETTNGTVNADVLAHFVPDFTRTTTVERVLGSAWPS